MKHKQRDIGKPIVCEPKDIAASSVSVFRTIICKGQGTTRGKEIIYDSNRSTRQSFQE